MKVKHLIDYLEEYNPEAEVYVTDENGEPDYFNISYGISDGVTKETAEIVFLNPLGLRSNKEK